MTANSRHVVEEIAALTRASQQVVDALSLWFETLCNSTVTQRRTSMTTPPTPVPATFRDLQVPASISCIDIEDALREASLRSGVDAPHATAPCPSQSGNYLSNTNLGTDSRQPNVTPSRAPSATPFRHRQSMTVMSPGPPCPTGTARLLTLWTTHHLSSLACMAMVLHL